MHDAYEIRTVAESVIGEDRVPTDVLERIIRDHGSEAQIEAAGLMDDPAGDESIYSLLDRVRAHPSYVAGTAFIRADFASDEAAAEARAEEREIIERMVEAGFDYIDIKFGAEARSA